MEKVPGLLCFRDEMFNSLTKENKNTFLELEKSLSGLDIVELIVKWYIYPEMLTKYVEQENSIDGVKKLVEALGNFIEDNNLEDEYYNNIEIYTKGVQSKLVSSLVDDGDQIKPDEIG